MARPRQPTALRMLKGERKDRRNDNEPMPAMREVVPPSWLCDAAVEVWNEYAPDLETKGVLTAWDLEPFAGWCDAVVRRQRAAAHLDAEGEVVEYPVFGRNGELTGKRPSKNLWLGVWKDANEVVARVGARFGLTPSDRSVLRPGTAPPSGRGPERLLTAERYFT